MRKGHAPVITMTQTAAWRRRHPEAVPLEQIAAIDFEPATEVAAVTAASFAQALEQYATAAATAAALVGMSKAEMVGLARRAKARGDNSDEQLALMMEDARVALQAAVDLLVAASARLKVAQAVVTVVSE
ncbi:hypothetical protein LJR219_004773 [Phenylobacterium sp. LjRoot219]|uniref:hypothetical protein n=1 Tax=Phenylobacterium sp. LjRoot219 TaxID=3342283 RepID=UPI003ECDADEA